MLFALLNRSPQPLSAFTPRMLAGLIVVAAGFIVRPVHAADEKPEKPVTKPKVAVENPFPKAFPAPDLEGGVEWLNAGGEISLKDLRGKVVLLDFWTFCCINCMHVLPDLKYLEHKYGKELVVIGVHSAKFDNEKETGNIRNAIMRYEIEHPVINDAQMTVWRKFQIRSWPSLVLIDPEGNYCGVAPGEGNRELLDTVIEKLVTYHRAKGTLDETPVRFDLERQRVATPLKFPGKLLIDEANKRLFVSDSNHNRIVVSTLDGKLIDVIGSGTIGSKDGGYGDSQFDHPQGMTLIGETLYVADTENHQIRTVDLAAKQVATLAGTGEQEHRFGARGGGLHTTNLNSPWDLCVVDGVLYVAMAGPHQLWSHKLGSERIQPYAGSGKENITDGDLDDGALAQPSGIVSDGKSLYVVDSEGSSIRKISTKPKQNLAKPTGEIRTIAGTHDLPNGSSLFAFGDVDGEGTAARLQHPLGIALHSSGLFVADSYNHKIKQIDLKTNSVTTFLGTGKPGTELKPVQFAEPAGIAIADDKMYVADTNNHRLVVVDMATKEARELVIDGLIPPKPVTAETTDGPELRVVAVEAQKRTVKDSLDFQVEFALPPDFKLNPLLPVKYKVAAEGDLIATDQQNIRQEATSDGGTATFKIPVTKATGDGTLVITVTYGYCREGKGGLCKVDTLKFKVPVELAAGSDTKPVLLKATPK